MHETQHQLDNSNCDNLTELYLQSAGVEIIPPYVCSKILADAQTRTRNQICYISSPVRGSSNSKPVSKWKQLKLPSVA